MAWMSGSDLSLIGLKKASTWGTAEDCDAADLGIRPTSFSWSDDYEQLPDNSFNQSAVRRRTTCTGRQTPGWQYQADLAYEGYGIALTSMFGADTNSGADPYTHIINLVNNLNYFTTAEWDTGAATHTMDSNICTSTTLSGEAGRVLQIAQTFAARKHSTAATGGLTSLARMSNVDFVKWDNSTIDFQIAAAASSLAAISLNSFTITFDWELDLDRAYIDEYIRQPEPGRFNTAVTLVKPYEDETYLSSASGAEYKLWLNFGLSASADFTIELPSLTFEQGSNDYSDMQGVPQTLTARSDTALSVPSGFTTHADPHLTLINSNSASYD